MADGATRWVQARPVVVAGAAGLTLLANLAGLLAGITIVLPHLLYVPIALAGYWYPRRGALIAVGIAAAYAAMALVFAPSDWLSVLSRAVTLTAVGVLIAYLSRRLAAGEARYRGLFDSSVAGIFVVDAGGIVRAVNARGAALVGLAPQELEGAPFPSISSDADSACAFLRYAARGATEDEQVDLLRAGRPVHCLASGAPLGDGLIVLTLVDVTSQSLARAALESANRTMATLARILDQDLSAELGALDALIEREREDRDDPETVALLREIGDLVNAIARRVAVAREFNELGARPPAWQPLGVAVAQARARLDPGPVALRAWVDRLEVYADPALPSALYHLLHNATRPAIGATTVVVSYHHAPDGCRVYIEDDGAGFPAAERAALDPQGGVQDRRGLSLVREALGITGIRVTEEGTGRGARFVLAVPQEACRVR